MIDLDAEAQADWSRHEELASELRPKRKAIKPLEDEQRSLREKILKRFGPHKHGRLPNGVILERQKIKQPARDSFFYWLLRVAKAE